MAEIKMATYKTDYNINNNPTEHITISMQDYSSMVHLAMQGQQPRGPPPPSGIFSIPSFHLF